jgi:hypothetical protein
LVSKLNQKVYAQIETWRNQKLEGRYPYVYLHGVVLKRTWSGEVHNLSVLVAIGVGEDGYRAILGVAEGAKEDLEGWRGFLRHLKGRGLQAPRLIISDACMGLVEAVAEHYPSARWQRCVVGLLKNPDFVLYWKEDIEQDGGQRARTARAISGSTICGRVTARSDSRGPRPLSRQSYSQSRMATRRGRGLLLSRQRATWY